MNLLCSPEQIFLSEHNGNLSGEGNDITCLRVYLWVVVTSLVSSRGSASFSVQHTWDPTSPPSDQSDLLHGHIS